MNDLISRQAAIKHLKKRLMETAINNFGVTMPCEMIFEDTAENRIEVWLNELPFAQPERKEGRWIFETLDGVPGYRPTVMFCSKCGRVSIADYSYCPNCGARMGVTE